MARNEKPIGKGKIKFRFIEFEMDGSDPTLQDAIKQITNAIGRPQVVKVQPAALGGSTGKASGNETADASDAEFEDEEESEVDETTPDDDSRSERAPSAPRKFKAPNIVKVDLRGDSPLRDFITKLQPESDAKRYMVIAYWFKTYRSIDEITADHIYTAYKEMSWSNIPKDVGGPLRLLKRQGSFVKGSGGGAYSLNHIGEGKVQDMINKGQAS